MHSLIVFLVLTFFVLLNLGCIVLQLRLVRRRAGGPAWLPKAIAFWGVAMMGLLLSQFLMKDEWKPWANRWLYFPLSVEMVWNLLFVQFYFLGLIVVCLISGRMRPTRPREEVPESARDLSRRSFIRTLALGAVPLTAIGMGVHGTVTRYDLRVRQFTIRIPGLQAGLEGFTIAHVSDLHAGVFCGSRRLQMIGEAVNDQKADLIAVTGDIVNNSFGEFDAAASVMERLEAPHGIYVCEGNHDLMAGPGVIGRACLQRNLPWLYSSGAAVAVNGCRVLLGGLPWMSHGFEGRQDIVNRLYPERQGNDVRILLAHHPHLFDIADGVDLVLSGHTHGGQIMAGEDVGFGPLFFKYWSGAYNRPGVNASLVVSNGCGDWFPCRIGAPAEIGLIRLTAG